jgi:hypothetical protein
MILLPLVFIYLVFDIEITVLVFLVGMVLLMRELSSLLETQNNVMIYIEKSGNWITTDQGGNNRDIGFKDFMRIGTAVFLLITLEGRTKRVLILENQQDQAQFHRLLIYLSDVGRADR